MSSMCFLSLRLLSPSAAHPALTNPLLFNHHQATFPTQNTKLNLEELKNQGGDW